ADVFAKISESGKTDAETEEIKKTIADHVRQAKAAADAQEWQNHVAKIFDVGDRQQAYNAAVEAYKNLCQDTLNKVKEGQLVDEKILTEQYTWMNKMADQVLKQKQSEKLDIELKHYEKKYLAEIDEIKSKINANNASAADSYSHVAVNKSQVDVNRAMEIDLKAAAKLSDAEMQSLAQEIVGAYIDETGMHVDPEKRAQVQHEIEKQLRYETKQHRQDYFNPFRIVGNLLGPAASVYHTSVLKKVIK
ncbi:MAG: hypothetical protein IJV27_03985, partial [Prevotella sp.]|nr:hypothetical protein [Prevotella sp.]